MARPEPFPPPPPWAEELVTVGVTGTNGKTSTVTWAAAALSAAGAPVPRVTTLGSFLGDEALDVEASYQGFLETMRRGRDAGARFAAIELTSEALAMGFAPAWPCRIGVFTNLSRDHLDAHGSAEHYLASKAQLFVHLADGGGAVLPAGDPAAELLAEVVPAGVRVIRTGLGTAAGGRAGARDLEAIGVEVGWEGTRVELRASAALGEAPAELVLRAIGSIYVENALAASAAAALAGVPLAAGLAAIARTPAPPGRFEIVARRPYVVVDFAHTPDAVARTVAVARSLCRGALTVVLGAGGERDAGKRRPMGEATAGADRVVVTSDNPRREDPAAIAAAVAEGARAGGAAVAVVLDRAEAIARALDGAGPEDVVVVAGKGHEATQEIAGERRPFRDAAVALAALGRRAGGGVG